MRLTLPGQLLPEAYPWCFVLPPCRKNGRFYVGALVRDGTPAPIKPVSALYAAVRYPWLQKNLATNFPLCFWLARIMAAQQKRDSAVNQTMPLKAWISALQAHYAPLRERLLSESYRFRSHSDLLLAALCEFDEIATEEKGVGRMPWLGWPEILQASSKAWLWRQSRYGKIIDSQQLDW